MSAGRRGAVRAPDSRASVPAFIRRAREPGPRAGAVTGPERRRLGGALLVSVLVHALLLGLTFGGGLGLPGSDWPWRERRTEAPGLRVLIVSPP